MTIDKKVLDYPETIVPPALLGPESLPPLNYTDFKDDGIKEVLEAVRKYIT